MPANLVKILAIIGLQHALTLLAPGAVVDPASAGAVPSVPEIASQGYQLVFSAEFKGTILDTARKISG